MAIDLVDGRAGKPHIDGDDLGDFKAGVCGTAGYVLCMGGVLEATQDDANHVTIGTGAMVMPGSGRHVRVTSPEQVTVTSGTQGQKRRDLIVMRADTGGSVESASLVCVRGTPVSYGTPADPAVEDGDLPLYRVELDGATAAAPVAVFDVLTPMSELRAGMDELRDSVSRKLDDIGVTTVGAHPAASWIYATAIRCPTGVVIGGNVTGNSVSQGSTILTVDLQREAAPVYLVMRGLFHGHQSAAKVEVSGSTLTVRMEQATSFSAGDTFGAFVPLTWA